MAPRSRVPSPGHSKRPFNEVVTNRVAQNFCHILEASAGGRGRNRIEGNTVSRLELINLLGCAIHNSDPEIDSTEHIPVQDPIVASINHRDGRHHHEAGRLVVPRNDDALDASCRLHTVGEILGDPALVFVPVRQRLLANLRLVSSVRLPMHH